MKKRIILFYEFKTITQIQGLRVVIDNKSIFEYLITEDEPIMVIRAEVKEYFDNLLEMYNLKATLVALSSDAEMMDFQALTKQEINNIKSIMGKEILSSINTLKTNIYTGSKVKLIGNEITSANLSDKENVFSVLDKTALLEKYSIEEFDLLSKEYIYDEYIASYEFEKAKRIVGSYKEGEVEAIVFAIQKNVELGMLREAIFHLNKLKEDDFKQINDYASKYPDVVHLIKVVHNSYGSVVWKVSDDFSTTLEAIENPNFKLKKLVVDKTQEMVNNQDKLNALFMIEAVRILLERGEEPANIFIRETLLKTYTQASNALKIASKALSTELVDYAKDKEVAYNHLGFYQSAVYSYLYILALEPSKFSIGSERTQKIMCDTIDLERRDNAPRNRLVKASPRGKKVAVCISGMTRYPIEDNLSNIEHMFSDLEVDYFVHTWETSEIYPGLGGLGYGPDKAWALKYFRGIGKVPESIDTVAKLMAELPEVAKKVIAPQVAENNTNIYKDILGSKLKGIKIEADDKLDKELNPERYTLRDNLNQAKMFYGMNEVCKVMEEYQEETGTEYEYIVRMRIDNKLKDKIHFNTFKSLEDNDVIIEAMRSSGVDDSLFLAKYHTGKKLLKLWESSLQEEAISPYYHKGEFIMMDSHKLLTTHIVYNKITIKICETHHYKPEYIHQVKIPNIDEALEKDNIESKSSEIQEYMNKLNDTYTKPLKYNTSYKNIDTVKVVRCSLEEDNTVVLDFKITGRGLLSIESNRFKLRARNARHFIDYKGADVYNNFLEPVSLADEQLIFRKKFPLSLYENGAMFKWSLLVLGLGENEFMITIDEDCIINESIPVRIHNTENRELIIYKKY